MTGNFGQRFGELVCKKRKLKGWSQQKLAEEAGIGNKSVISRLENGLTDDPNSNTKEVLIEKLGIEESEMAECLGHSEIETPQPETTSSSYGLPRELLENIATRFGAENPDAPEAELVAYLKQSAKDWRALKERMAALEVLDGNLSNLLGEAERLMDAGDFDSADDRLADAEELQVTERALKEAAKAAEIASTRADAALLGGRETRAATHITRAAGFIAGFEGDTAAHMRRNFAIRLYERALAFGGAGFVEAIKLYALNLTHWQFETDKANWAMAQNDLAIALRNQAARVEGAAGADLLADAITAFEAALEVYTREDAPQDWGMTQNNLGNALCNQAARVEEVAGVDLLADAVAAFKAALEVHTREDAPQDWAATQNNLGNALYTQAMRVEGAAGADLLADAVAAFEAALEVHTREDAPQHWAMTQENLGYLFKFSATRSDDPKQDLTTALKHLDAALEIYDPVHTSYYHTKCTAARDQVLAALVELD